MQIHESILHNCLLLKNINKTHNCKCMRKFVNTYINHTAGNSNQNIFFIFYYVIIYLYNTTRHSGIFWGHAKLSTCIRNALDLHISTETFIRLKTLCITLQLFKLNIRVENIQFYILRLIYDFMLQECIANLLTNNKNTRVRNEQNLLSCSKNSTRHSRPTK